MNTTLSIKVLGLNATANGLVAVLCVTVIVLALLFVAFDVPLRVGL